MDTLPFRTLLYRYFFFNWLFKDAGQGDLFERAAISRYNRQQARWLPTYMLRWVSWSLLFYLLGEGAERVLDLPALATWLYAIGSLGVAFCVMAATAWVGITQRQERF